MVRRNLGDRALVYVTFKHVTCSLEQINRENQGSNPEYVIFPEGKFRIIGKRDDVYTLECVVAVGETPTRWRCLEQPDEH